MLRVHVYTSTKPWKNVSCNKLQRRGMRSFLFWLCLLKLYLFFLCFHCHKNCDLKKVYSNGFCLVSGSDDLQVYRYNEEKTLSWLQSKVGVKASWYTFSIPPYQPTNHWLTRRWSHDTTSLYNVFIYFVFHWFTFLRVLHLLL